MFTCDLTTTVASMNESLDALVTSAANSQLVPVGTIASFASDHLEELQTALDSFQEMDLQQQEAQLSGEACLSSTIARHCFEIQAIAPIKKEIDGDAHTHTDYQEFGGVTPISCKVSGGARILLLAPLTFL